MSFLNQKYIIVGYVENKLTVLFICTNILQTYQKRSELRALNIPCEYYPWGNKTQAFLGR